MSYILNQKEVFSASSSNSSNFEESEILSNFFLKNNDPTEEEIEKFCNEQNVDRNSVILFNLIFQFYKDNIIPTRKKKTRFNQQKYTRHQVWK